MIPAIIGENKQDIAAFAAGAGAGTLLGGQLYKVLPDKMAHNISKNGKQQKVITDKFITYARKISEQDLYNTIDPHTERTWINEKLGIIRRMASKAKINPNGQERFQFQKIYDKGMLFLTNRDEIHHEDLGLARRGANAITYGRKVAKRNTAIICALAVGAAFVAGKKLIENFKEKKQ